jgi:ribonuclease HI
MSQEMAPSEEKSQSQEKSRSPEVPTPDELFPAPEPGRKSGGPGSRREREWPELTAAAGLKENPLPVEGEQVLEAWTDGASRGNPGPAAIGIVFRQKDGPALATDAEAIGRATNNEAEYRAVIRALEHCQRWRVEKLDLYVDSELVARQLRGLYRVKSPSLRPLYQQAAHLARGLRQFRVRHVPRERNRHADHLANSALGPAASRRAG